MVTKPQQLNVLFLASEADPLVKVGGLGDVAGSLPPAIRQLNLETNLPGLNLTIDIRLAIPYHGVIRRSHLQVTQVAAYSIPHVSGLIPVEVFLTERNGLPIYLISGPMIPPEAAVYSDDHGSDGLKYVFYSMAALELARALDWPLDILHGNDWHTAPAVYALALNRRTDAFYRNTVSILGIHNLPYMGVGSSAALGSFGLPPTYDFHLPAWAQYLALPLGLLTADQIVAVSPGYAQEILTPEFGAGLQGFLRTRSASISGILNGLDNQRWDPATDDALAAPFDLFNLELRSKNKMAMQREFNLAVEPARPLIAMITRMDFQKGIDLAIGALRKIFSTKQPVRIQPQIILLGTGMADLEQAALQLETDFPEQARAAIRFDSSLSRRIYGGADMLLMPSRYEPCGLAQMIALRYGCVPIARATGGLRDTIQDYSPSTGGTGFLFTETTDTALAAAIDRALTVYTNPGAWRKLQIQGMQQDFSWERSAVEYIRLYLKMVHRPIKPTD